MPLVKGFFNHYHDLPMGVWSLTRHDSYHEVQLLLDVSLVTTGQLVYFTWSDTGPLALCALLGR
jgi:steroid 5-alpha reductase family enzyme